MDSINPVMELVNNVWRCSGEDTDHICHLKENLDSLRVAMEDLQILRNDVKQRVDFAEAQRMGRRPIVSCWLLEVEKIEREVNEMLEPNLRQQMGKCWCWPKHCWRSYKLGKKVLKNLDRVKELKKNAAEFREVADRSTPFRVQGRPESPTVGMKPLLDKAMKLLEDAEVSTLGIYGMAGVGKTTLLTKINNQFLHKETKKDVDLVIWVTVSREANLAKIQSQIANRLGLTKGDERDQQVILTDQAGAIFNILSRKKFVLLLDNCWEDVDLKRIGIPDPNLNQVGRSESKVVFTTRSELVCELMEAKMKMRVECLDRSEAWELFKEKVGQEALYSDPQVPKLAQDVAKWCSGLPLALVSVGRAMASKKTPQEWKHAITLLKKYISEFSGMGDEVFPLFKFSYDNLQDDTLKSCFLYCSLYPEDFDIKKDDLILHWIGEGFLDEFESMDEAYDKGHDIIGSLKAVSLLESGVEDSETQVKMHDAIRDLAIWIGCEYWRKKENLLVQPAANLGEAPPRKKWKEAERVSLMYNGIRTLGDDVPIECSNLLSLLLNGNLSLHHISDNIFQCMPNLKVLNLSRTAITHLPKSISNLKELQLLHLEHCCELEELPVELKYLVKLKCLDLSNTGSLVRIPQGVISGLSNLQMLNLFRSGGLWDSERDGASLLEAEHLERLSVLGYSIHVTPRIQMFLNTNKKVQLCTQHLEISFSDTIHAVLLSPPSFEATTSTLPPSDLFKPDTLNVWEMKNLRRLRVCDSHSLRELRISRMGVEEEEVGPLSSLEMLQLEGLNALTIIWEKEVLSQCQCFRKLHTIDIDGCHALKDLSWLLYVPNLKTLDICDCEELESILLDNEVEQITNQSYENPFSRLKNLKLKKLPKLESICGHALPFPFLQDVTVILCPRLQKLPFDNNSALAHCKVSQGVRR